MSDHVISNIIYYFPLKRLRTYICLHCHLGGQCLSTKNGIHFFGAIVFRQNMRKRVSTLRAFAIKVSSGEPGLRDQRQCGPLFATWKNAGGGDWLVKNRRAPSHALFQNANYFLRDFPSNEECLAHLRFWREVYRDQASCLGYMGLLLRVGWVVN